jgi:hypothetical protein
MRSAALAAKLAYFATGQSGAKRLDHADRLLSDKQQR